MCVCVGGVYCSLCVGLGSIQCMFSHEFLCKQICHFLKNFRSNRQAATVDFSLNDSQYMQSFCCNIDPQRRNSLFNSSSSTGK